MKKQRGYGDVLVIAVMVLVILGVLGLTYALKSVACTKQAKMMGLRSDYAFFTGCMVQVGNRYAPINYIRIVDDKVIIQGDGE